eukprot:1488899-Pyramimonas_sp.AAC.1
MITLLLISSIFPVPLHLLLGEGSDVAEARGRQRQSLCSRDSGRRARSPRTSVLKLGQETGLIAGPPSVSQPVSQSSQTA